LITVLILMKPVSNLQPILDSKKSLSLIPVSTENSLLSVSFSWINSYFSKDKIYVVCTSDEEDDVKISCKGINGENIIIEPDRINYSISVFYATLVIGKMYPDEVIFFIPVNFLFKQDAKIGNWLFALDEMAVKDWVIIPSIQLGREDKETSYLDAGKIIENVKGIDFFGIESFIYSKEEIKKKKLFGKYGKYLQIICGKQKSILDSFIKDNKNLFIKILYDYFKSDDINWETLKKDYENVDPETIEYEYFAKNRNFLTIFLDTKPYYLDNWYSIFDRFSQSKDRNIFSGKVVSKNCSNVICLNFDDDEISIDSINNIVIFKKNGRVAINSILL
jgi:mannose-1-phosphate guanylyltransferase